MKRIFTFVLLGVCAFGSAQTIKDVLRYGLEENQGTARYQAMGGAFGALGGDLSALNVNPAGSAVFQNGFFTMSGTFYDRDNVAGFAGDQSGFRGTSFKLNQVGGVFVFKNPSTSGWNKMALAFNYDMVDNYANEFRVIGDTPNGLDNYFLGFADGVPLGPLRVQEGETIVQAYLDIGANLGFADQQAFLGFQAGFIDPVDPDDDNNTAYFSNANYGNVVQDYVESSAGYNSKFTANFSAAYEDTFFLGASMNFHSVLYERFTYLNETGYDSDSPIQSSYYDTFLRSVGSGFSFSIGGIAKVNDFLRVGGTYQSPTWYRFVDDFSQRTNTDFADRNPDITRIDFSVVNLFGEYRIDTPAKYTGSLALVFGKQGLLSFDYDYQDFSRAQLRPSSDPEFSSENQFISGALRGVSTFRLGGEYRIKQVSLRAGYRYQQSPWVDNSFAGDLQGYSGGIGYTFGPNRLDFAYARSTQDTWSMVNDGGLSDIGVNRITNYFSMSYSLNF